VLPHFMSAHRPRLRTHATLRAPTQRAGTPRESKPDPRATGEHGGAAPVTCRDRDRSLPNTRRHARPIRLQCWRRSAGSISRVGVSGNVVAAKIICPSRDRGYPGRVRGQPIGAPIAIEPKGAAWPMVCCVQFATPAAGGVLERRDEPGPTQSGPVRKGESMPCTIDWDGREVTLTTRHSSHRLGG
jgi:hypothetical protein